MKASKRCRDRIRAGSTALVVAALLLVGGCANYQTRVADGKPLSDQAYEGDTMHALLWGAYVKPEIMSAEDCKHGMYDVVAENNYLYSLVSVVTIGIWMPLDVKYRCKAPGVQGGGTVPTTQ